MFLRDFFLLFIFFSVAKLLYYLVFFSFYLSLCIVFFTVLAVNYYCRLSSSSIVYLYSILSFVIFFFILFQKVLFREVIYELLLSLSSLCDSFDIFQFKFLIRSVGNVRIEYARMHHLAKRTLQVGVHRKNRCIEFLI